MLVTLQPPGGLTPVVESSAVLALSLAFEWAGADGATRARPLWLVAQPVPPEVVP
jgi:hypothetical protein